MKRVFFSLALAVFIPVILGAMPGAADLRALQSPSYVLPGEPFSATLSIKNNSIEDIYTIELEFLAKGGDAMTIIHRFDTPVAYSETREFTVDSLICDVTGDNVYADLTLKSVNGQVNYGQTGYMYMFCASEFVPRRVVVEEGASVNCGWCPRGYESMEYMRNKYSSDKWIGISYQQHGDMAATETFASFWNRLAGKPFSYINRNYNYACSPLPETFEEVMSQNEHAPAIAEVTARMIDENSIDVSVRFVFDYENADFRVAYILTEDNLGPYTQRNYYADGGNGTFMGWENKNSYESLIYNDIARPGSNYDGIANLLPENITAGKTYSLTLSPDLSHLTNRSNAYVSVLVTKGKDGIIANAVKIPLKQDNSGLSDPNADSDGCDCQIHTVGTSGISIESRYGGMVADISGRIVAKHSGHDSILLAPGIYIVYCGTHSHKTAVY